MPVGNSHALLISFPCKSEKRLRPVLSRQEALDVIADYPTMEVDDFTDHSGAVEEQHFKSQMKEGTCGDSVRIVKTVRRRIQHARAIGRKPPVVYERVLREASTRSLSELAVALGSTPEDVKALFEKQEASEGDPSEDES
jgi:CarD family transcriptional regulator